MLNFKFEVLVQLLCPSRGTLVDHQLFLSNTVLNKIKQGRAIVLGTKLQVKKLKTKLESAFCYELPFRNYSTNDPTPKL